MEARSHSTDAIVTVNRPSGIADLVEAIETLRPTDDETRRAIARMLGFRWPVSDGRGTQAPKTFTQRLRVMGHSPGVVVAQPQATSSNQASRSSRAGVDSELTWSGVSPSAAPQWLSTSGRLRETESRHLRPALPLETLFETRTSRAIVSGALATPALVGGMDVVKVLAHICRAEAITQIPQKPVPTLVRGVQVLIDRSETMQPFAVDQALLSARIVDVVGRDRTSIMYFTGSPQWGAGVGPPDDWPRYKPPVSGTPVLVLSDLGIARPREVAGMATQNDWWSFAALLARAGCPLVAFVPYPPRRWPPLIRHRMTIVQWDRATTASTVRQTVGVGLQVVEELR